MQDSTALSLTPPAFSTLRLGALTDRSGREDSSPTLPVHIQLRAQRDPTWRAADQGLWGSIFPIKDMAGARGVAETILTIGPPDLALINKVGRC